MIMDDQTVIAAEAAGVPDSDFYVIGYGLCYCSVCTSLDDEAAVVRVNRESPTGTSSDWSIDGEGHFADGTPNPSPCPHFPGYRHLLFSC